MNSEEVSRRTREINRRVYGVFLLSAGVSVVVCGLGTWLVSRRASDTTALLTGLGLAILFLGLPLGWALARADRAYKMLRAEAYEDLKAESFATVQKFIHEYKKKEATDDEQDEEDFRSGDPEHG